MEGDFTNREITTMFEEVKTILKRIEEQTTKTNGRVTELEKINEKKEGAFSIVRYLAIFVISVLLSYLAWLGMQVSDIHQTLSLYDVYIES